MGTQPKTIEVLLEQLERRDDVSARKMFGEYGLYSRGQLFGLVCDDQLFVKVTPAGKTYAPDLDEAAPYPGAKPSLLVAGERWEDADWLCGLVSATLAALPLPKPKSGRSKP